MHDTYELITRCLAQHLGIESETLAPQRTFTDLQMDSLALVELVVVLEEETGAQLSEDASAFTDDMTLERAAELLAQAMRTDESTTLAPAATTAEAAS
ncbi:phosphopantetheine-binding protein [Streptomyces niger]|uniref:phosphopantetheine-binding protein n=1 Tax=Streptomyces niger TaxID=66373 RepID=UPI000699EBC0|nr:phosphopantetheine-binding protein [Streptomyces niger]